MSETQKMQRSAKNRIQVREEARNEVRRWYFLSVGGNPDDEDGDGVEAVECDHADALTGEIRWWLEPLVKGVPNPMVVERPLGNNDWSISIEAMPTTIRSFGGI